MVELEEEGYVVNEMDSEQIAEDESILDETPSAPDIDSDDVDNNEENMLFATLKQKIKETMSSKTTQKQREKPKEEEVEKEEIKETEPRHIVSWIFIEMG